MSTRWVHAGAHKLVTRTQALTGQAFEIEDAQERSEVLIELIQVVDAIGWELVAGEEQGECSRFTFLAPSAPILN